MRDLTKRQWEVLKPLLPALKKLGRPPSCSKALSGRRWIVEGTFAWLNSWRGIAVRCARRSYIYRGAIMLAAIAICLNALLK